jgi:hypothetical protein
MALDGQCYNWIVNFTFVIFCYLLNDFLSGCLRSILVSALVLSTADLWVAEYIDEEKCGGVEHVVLE